MQSGLFFVLTLSFCLFMAAVTMAQTPIPNKTSKTIYKNGGIKQISHQGLFNGCGVPVGTDSVFFIDGRLMKTVNYKHQKEKGEGCHSIITKQTIVTYYQNGKRHSVQYFDACYECTPHAVGNGNGLIKEGN